MDEQMDKLVSISLAPVRAKKRNFQKNTIKGEEFESLTKSIPLYELDPSSIFKRD